MSLCILVCVCVKSFKGACGCKHSALYVVTVNGKDALKFKFWAETENSGCAWSKTKT